MFAFIYWWEVIQMWRVLITDLMFWRKTCDLCGLRFPQSNRLNRRVQSYRVESLLQLWHAVLCELRFHTLCTLMLERNLSKWHMLIHLLYNYKYTLLAPVLDRTPSNVALVATVLLWAEPWSDICALILGRNLSNVKHVDYGLLGVELWRSIVRSHTGEKLFNCETCGLSLVDSGHLKSHNYAQSYWGETVQMWLAWQMFCCDRNLEATSAHSYWGEAIHMWTMWIMLGT